MNTKAIYSLILLCIFFLCGLFISSCVSDIAIDPAGCITCVKQNGDTEQACADGAGVLTIISNGDPSTARTTEELNLTDFRTTQEASGAECN